MKDYNVILFDLDGTLTDPKGGITKSVQYALRKMGIIEENLDDLLKFIGPPLTESFRDYYGMDESDTWEAIKFYREYFTDKGMLDNEIFPGIPELLSNLRSRGHNLGVATSKPTVYSEVILKHFEIDNYFSVVIGSNLDGTRMIKSEIIEFALKTLQVPELEKVIMIGDRKHDIIGAKQNNIDSIGVVFGYGSREELERAGATYLANTVGELAGLFKVDL